jgi:WD40 repeat protein
VALSGDGRQIASGGVDGTVRLRETEGGRPIATLHGHTVMVYGVALSADGQLVATGGDDGTVRLWETSSGALRSVSRVERRFEDLDITGLTGITDAQRGTLLTLGAIERRGNTAPAA